MWAQRFDAFVRRKEQEARDASLEGFVTEEDRSGSLALERIGNGWTTGLFDGPFFWTARATGRSLNLVFVQSLDGNTVADDPAELGGGATDKHLVYEGLSRVHVDGVMAGARTAWGPGDLFFSVWHPELVVLRASLGLARHPAQIVVSTQCERLQDSLMFNVPEAHPTVITTDSGAECIRDWAPSRPWMTVITTGRSLDLRMALERLAIERDIRLISAVGGRTLAASLIDAAVVDDLYLTTSPRRGGEPDTPLYTKGPIEGQLVVRKRGCGQEAGVRFEHFTRINADQ